MLIKFMFTDSPRGERLMRDLPGVQYEVHDSNGDLILMGQGGIHNIDPGDYCIYGTRMTEGDEIYFGEEKFNIPEGDPGAVSICGPAGCYHMGIMVYMVLIPRESVDPTACPDMWPQENGGEDGDGGFPWLLALMIIIAMGASR